MEHYWCLRWLSQHSLRQAQAVQLKDDLLRLTDIPLMVPMIGVKHPRGTQLTIELISWDEIDLSFQARLLEVSNVIEEVDDNLQFEASDLMNEVDHVSDQRVESPDGATEPPVVIDSVVEPNPASFG